MTQWYYAKNGQKIGPVEKSRILELFNQGEISPTDLVWEEGMAAWNSAAQVLSTPPPMPTAPPLPPSVQVETPLPDNLEFHPTDCIKRGWRLTWKYPLNMIGGCLLGMLLMNAPSMILNVIIYPFVLVLVGLGSLMESQPIMAITVIGSISLVGFAILVTLMGACIAPIVSGVYWMILRIIRGSAPDISDLFYGFKKPQLKELACLGAVVSLLGFAGLLLLVIPGIYIMLAYLPSYFLVIDKKMPWREAMKLSRHTVNQHLGKFFGLFLLNFLIGIAGVLACYIGIFIAMPVSLAAIVYTYEILFKKTTQDNPI